MFRKYIIPFIFICSIIYPQDISQSAVASVNLLVPLSITSIGGTLDFGEIILTGSSFTQTISPSSGQKILVSGHPNRNATIVFTPTTLSNGGSPELIERVGTLAFNPIVQNSAGSIINSGSTMLLIDKGKVGEFELLIGGSINIKSDQPHGDYIGTFTLTISY